MPIQRARGRLLIAVTLAGLSAGSSQAQAQDTAKADAHLRALETESQQVSAEPISSQRTRSATYVEERLTDGELYYRLQDYVRASIILTDIVDNYPQHRATPDALFMLGESLYAAGDYLGARTRLRQVIDHSSEPAYRPYASRSLGRLIEIAIRTRNFDGVDGYFETLSRLPPQEVEAATAYFRAKYLFSRAVPADDVVRGGADLKAATLDKQGIIDARNAFEGVAEKSPYYPQARYFVGVTYTLERAYPQAVEAFRRVLRVPVTTPEHMQVVELAQLALGRLFYESEQLDQAVEAYQNVPRTSKWFDVALYEIAWVYIRMGDSTRAERALEVLSIAAPDSRYIADASVLRGNLLLRNGNLDEAAKVFEQTSGAYSPVRQKLDNVIANHSDSVGYFRGLVRENMEVFDASTILPPEAAPFATDEPDMDRALTVLSDLAKARLLVRDTSELMTRLEGALGAPNLVNVFADLRRHRQKTTVVRNRATQVRTELVNILEGQTGKASGDLAKVREERRALYASLGALPTSQDEFAVRDEASLGGFTNSGKELSKMEVDLLGMEARLVATERFMMDTLNTRENREGVAAMQTELGQQRTGITAFRDQIHALKLTLEAGRLQVGVGDAVYNRDEGNRKRFDDLVQRERELLAAQGARVDPAIDAMFRRVSTVEAAMATRDSEIDRVVAERQAEVRQELASEATHVEGYRTQLAALETEAEEVVGGVTYASFANVRQRVYDLVLRSDVGTIDVSWADREEHRVRVEMLTRERAREMRALDDEFQEIMEGAEDGGER